MEDFEKVAMEVLVGAVKLAAADNGLKLSDEQAQELAGVVAKTAAPMGFLASQGAGFKNMWTAGKSMFGRGMDKGFGNAFTQGNKKMFMTGMRQAAPALAGAGALGVGYAAGHGAGESDAMKRPLMNRILG